MLSVARCLSTALFAVAALYADPLLYVTNEGGNTTGIYTLAGAASGTLNPAVPFSTPYVVTGDGAGDVYVSDYSNGRVVEFGPGGSQLATFSAGLGNPGGLALDGQGDLFVVDRSNGNILEYSSSGGESVIATVAGARGLVYENGQLYTASSTTGDVVRMATDGSGQTTVASAVGTGDLRGLAFDSAGDLFISDVTGGSIYKLAAGSTTLTLFASGLQGPEYLAVDAAGTLYVPEYFGDDVRLIGANGANDGVLITGLDAPSSVALVATPEPGYGGLVAVMVAMWAVWRARFGPMQFLSS